MGRAPRPEGAIAFAPMIHSTTEHTEDTESLHSRSFVFIPASIRVEKAFTTEVAEKHRGPIHVPSRIAAKDRKDRKSREVRKWGAGKCSYPPCSYRPLQVPSFRFQVSPSPRPHVSIPAFIRAENDSTAEMGRAPRPRGGIAFPPTLPRQSSRQELRWITARLSTASPVPG